MDQVINFKGVFVPESQIREKAVLDVQVHHVEPENLALADFSECRNQFWVEQIVTLPDLVMYPLALKEDVLI